MFAQRQAPQTAWSLLQATRRWYSMGGVTAPSSRNLWDIVKKEQFEQHDARHIHDIWMEFHADPNKHRVAATMTPAMFTVLGENAVRSPMFVLPIFKGPNAFETILVQCQMPCMLFTSLEEYKLKGPVATPFMSVTHYPQIQDKGLVLVRGDIIDPNGLSPFEASTLIRLAHEFYTDSKKHQFVHTFNHAPSSFDFKRMLDSMGHNTADIPQSS